MSKQRSLPIRISCPQCGGKVKVPSFEDGQKYECSRCGADLVASGGAPSKASATADGKVDETPPPSDAATLHLSRPGWSLDKDTFGITCHVCETRLHVHPMEVGKTIKCPDCFSPVTITPPPKRDQPWHDPEHTWEDDDGPSAKLCEAQTRLKRARTEQEQEEAEERESSPERFTGGLLAFFSDRHALARMAALAIWFELAMVLFRYVARMRIAENAPSMIAQAGSLMATLVLAAMLIAFLYAVAACGLSLIRDTSAGLARIEHWPEFNVVRWERDVFYVVNAGFLATLPGIALGVALNAVGVRGMVLYTAAASFGATFPPILLSMFESNSMRAPFLREAWSSTRRRPEPWKLTYLISAVVIIAGLYAFFACLISGFFLGPVKGFLLGLAIATAMVGLMMIYFRAVGRLFCYLSGRDGAPASE